ncbi:MAG: hypothetical protein HRT58_21360 [Crocinitomicaceae bacterium]|nr:hypothetical protein [Flavobacteriales bacterium]NQZ38222.1 hypothetical protein [Crocinitomicaceae bacterium]
MKILEITLENPISHTEIIRLKSEIETGRNYHFLLIDTGKHEFISLGVIKYFREQMQSMETHLLTFEKIALIHPPEYRNESSEPERYNYFTSRVEAKEWFLNRTK